MNKTYLNQKEAAEYIGVAVNTFKAHVRPFVKQKPVGNIILFSRQDIDEFISLDHSLLRNKLKRGR